MSFSFYNPAETGMIVGPGGSCLASSAPILHSVASLGAFLKNLCKEHPVMV